MKDIIKIIGIKKVAALLAVLAVFGVTSQPITDGKEAKPAAKEESILLGPFTLAELCEKGGRFAKEYARDGGPTEADILKALGACKIYLLDKKTLEKGKWRFIGGEYPKLVADGPFRFELKDKKKNSFIIQLVSFSAGRQSTSYSKSSAARGSLLHVVLRVEGTWGLCGQTVGVFHTSAVINFNINGEHSGLKGD